MLILVTRPIEDSQRTVEALRTKGHDALIAPLFEIKPLMFTLPQPPDYLLATSANAIKVCDEKALAVWLALPFFAVGDATASAAKKAGFSQVISAGADSVALAALIRLKAQPGARLLQLAGKPRRDVAIQALAPDFSITAVETYETVASERLPEVIADAIARQSLDAVLHFSPRAATLFMDLIAAENLTTSAAHLSHICISNAARDERFVKVRIANKPTLTAMIEAVSAI